MVNMRDLGSIIAEEALRLVGTTVKVAMRRTPVKNPDFEGTAKKIGDATKEFGDRVDGYVSGADPPGSAGSAAPPLGAGYFGGTKSYEGQSDASYCAECLTTHYAGITGLLEEAERLSIDEDRLNEESLNRVKAALKDLQTSLYDLGVTSQPDRPWIKELESESRRIRKQHLLRVLADPGDRRALHDAISATNGLYGRANELLRKEAGLEKSKGGGTRLTEKGMAEIVGEFRELHDGLAAAEDLVKKDDLEKSAELLSGMAGGKSCRWCAEKLRDIVDAIKRCRELAERKDPGYEKERKIVLDRIAEMRGGIPTGELKALLESGARGI